VARQGRDPLQRLVKYLELHTFITVMDDQQPVHPAFDVPVLPRYLRIPFVNGVGDVNTKDIHLQLQRIVDLVHMNYPTRSRGNEVKIVKRHARPLVFNAVPAFVQVAATEGIAVFAAKKYLFLFVRPEVSGVLWLKPLATPSYVSGLRTHAGILQPTADVR
jgi:hypothetical protein